jgi:tellurite resistance protein
MSHAALGDKRYHFALFRTQPAAMVAPRDQTMSTSSPSVSVLRARQILEEQSLHFLPNRDKLTSSAQQLARHAKGESFLACMVEAAFLVSSADAMLAHEEVTALADIISEVTGKVLSPKEIADLAIRYLQALSQDGRQARVDAIAAHVTDPAEQREVLSFAALVALCDHELAAAELVVLHGLGRVFGLNAQDVSTIVKDIAGAMGS